jgi:O-antigen ligase
MKSDPHGREWRADRVAYKRLRPSLNIHGIMATRTRPLPTAANPSDGLRGKGLRLVRWITEAVLLVLVCASPWAFGAVEPLGEFLLLAGVGLLAILWTAGILLEGRLSWRKCPVALCLAALYLLGIWQLTPLSRPILRALSPATARMYDQILPAEPEMLPAGQMRTALTPPPGSTISLYPGATRQELIRLLAFLLVFVVVRNNIASAASLRRLSIAAVVNGALLSLFALVQYFSSPHDTVFWTYHPGGEVFGPFICRNHFSFYVNVCAGLAVGLLLSFGASDARRGANRRTAWSDSFSAFLQDPRRLWVGIGLVLMLSAIAVSLSRGGFLALTGAAILCLILLLRQSRRFAPLGAAVVVVGVTFALVSWFGADRIKARLATVYDGRAAVEDRAPLWSRLLPVAAEYPLWGAGYGTFDYVEPSTRTTGADVNYRYEHAHNDYLESLLEGGLIRLVLVLAIIALVYWLGLRALARHTHAPTAGLILGGLFGFTALAIHSFVDFGLHIPAIALLAAVLCAQLCGAAKSGNEGVEDIDTYRFRLGGLAPMAGAVVVVGLGLVLTAEGLRAERVHEWRQTAAHPRKAPDLAQHERAVAYLEAASALTPDDGVLSTQLGEAHLELYQEQTEALALMGGAADAAQIVAAPPGLAGLGSWRLAATAREQWTAARSRRFAHEQIGAGLRRLLQARDACPLLAEPNLQLAIHIGALDKADARAEYLRRVKLLAPDDPGQWYLCGVQELFDGQSANAWQSWRHSLELSNQYLPNILAGAARSPDVPHLLDQLLPERADLWFAAADQLYADPTAAEKRRPLLEKALRFLQAQAGPLSADELHREATVCATLGRQSEALAAYEQALDDRPDQVDWRVDYARLLRDQGYLNDSRRELSLVLGSRPGDPQARDLLEAVEHDIAAGK